MAKLFDFIAISWEELGYFMKISINIGQMRYCCSISMKIWGNLFITPHHPCDSDRPIPFITVHQRYKSVYSLHNFCTPLYTLYCTFLYTKLEFTVAVESEVKEVKLCSWTNTQTFGLVELLLRS